MAKKLTPEERRARRKAAGSSIPLTPPSDVMAARDRRRGEYLEKVLRDPDAEIRRMEALLSADGVPEALAVAQARVAELLPKWRRELEKRKKRKIDVGD